MFAGFVPLEHLLQVLDDSLQMTRVGEQLLDNPAADLLVGQRLEGRRPVPASPGLGAATAIASFRTSLHMHLSAADSADKEG